MQVTPRRAAPEADATRDLYERFARQIYTYCLHQLGSKEEAEDAMQSTFLNAFRGFKRGVDPEFESAWLYKIAQNVCLTRQRSSSRRRRVESPGDLDAMQDILPSRETDPHDLIGLPQALEGLPAQQRRALLLREWQGLSYKEIATELDLSQAAVETLLFRARRSLAAGLTDEPSVTKRVVNKLRAGSDASSLVALLQTMFSFGGAKVAATVATVAATSVVAATPAARHAVEHAVTPVDPQHVTPRAHVKQATPKTAAATSAAHARALVALPAGASNSSAHPANGLTRHVRAARVAVHSKLRLGAAPTGTPDTPVGATTAPAVAAPPPVSSPEPTALTPDPAPPVTEPTPAEGRAETPAAPATDPAAAPTRRKDGGTDRGAPTASSTSASDPVKALLSAWSGTVPTTQPTQSRRSPAPPPPQPAPATTPTPTAAPLPPAPTVALPAAPDPSALPTTTATPTTTPPPPTTPPQGHRR